VLNNTEMKDSSAKTNENIEKEKEVEDDCECEPRKREFDWEEPFVGKLPENKNGANKHCILPAAPERTVRIDGGRHWNEKVAGVLCGKDCLSKHLRGWGPKGPFRNVGSTVQGV
jgi:hypothetical protein